MMSTERWPEGAAEMPAARPGGLWGRWLRLTAPAGDPNDTRLPLARRDVLRRSRLASAIILGLLAMSLVLLPTVTDDLPSLLGVLIFIVACVIAAVLNRTSYVTVSGYLLVLVLTAVIAVIFVDAPGGVAGLDYFPIYDLLTVPLLIAASLLPRGQVFIIAAINIAFIMLDAFLQPHGFVGMGPGGHWTVTGRFSISNDDGYSLIAKPVILQVLIAIVSFLWARSMDQALRRADRAEEFAAIEHEMAEQKVQLDVGIRQILDTHVRVANGDYNARAPCDRDNVLFQIAASLNTLLNRLGRAAQAEYFLQRTSSEIARLRDSLIAARAGRQPLWPAPNGTPVDALIEVLAAPSMDRPGAQLPPGVPGMPGAMPGLTTAGLDPTRAANSGPFMRGGGQLMGTPPFGGPPRGGFEPPDPFGAPYGARAPNSGGQAGRPMGTPDYGAGPGWGAPGPHSGPAGQGSQGSQGNGQESPWQLPDMPPLPDWLLPNDGES